MNTPRAPKLPGFPLHLLNFTQTKLWLKNAVYQKRFARKIVRKYSRTGFGVMLCNQWLVAKVDPAGRIEVIPPPHKKFEIWQAANAPQVSPEDEGPKCACLEYYYPEAQGPWKLTKQAERGEHHPFCQFHPHAVRTYDAAMRTAVQRLGSGLDPQSRPDEWQRMSDKESGK